MLLRKAFRARVVDLVLLQRQVYFVAAEGQDKAILIRRRVCLHLVDPVLHRLERTLARQIIADNGTNGISVVHVDHGAEALMTTRIPNVHFHLLLGA